MGEEALVRAQVAAAVVVEPGLAQCSSPPSAIAKTRIRTMLGFSITISHFVCETDGHLPPFFTGPPVPR